MDRKRKLEEDCDSDVEKSSSKMLRTHTGASLGFTEDGCEIKEREQFVNSLSYFTI